MKTFRTICDMAAIKIFTDDVSLFFANHVGDGTNTVHVFSQKEKKAGEAFVAERNWEFEEHFTVKTKAWLSAGDCEDSKRHEFPPGRYFVYVGKNQHFAIIWTDKDVHA